MEAALEANFGKTIQYNRTTEKYDIIQYKGNKRQIHQRYTNYNGLSILVHPQLANFKFDPIQQKISQAKEWLETNKGSCHKRKVAYLNGMKALIQDFNRDNIYYKSAVQSFVKLLNSIHELPKYQEFLSAIRLVKVLLKQDEDLFKILFNKKIADELAKKEKQNHFCGVLPNSILVSEFFTATKEDEHFWSNEEVISTYFNAVPEIHQLIAMIASEILSKEQNQSSLERILGSCSTREVSRPKLSVKTLMAEELSHHLYRQWRFFEACGYEHESLDELEFKYENTNNSNQGESQGESQGETDSEVDEVKMCINECLRDQNSYDKHDDPPIIFFNDGPGTSTDIIDCDM